MERRSNTTGLELDLDEGAAASAVQAVLRRLLRAATPEEVVSELVGLVHTFGGWTVPAQLQDDRTLPVDLSLGVLAEPVLPSAEPYSSARLHLEVHLPLVLEDARAILARLEQTARAQTDAAVDPLTGLLNRRGAARLKGQSRDGDAVVVLDLDNFKTLNDTNGHEAGDLALRSFADVLRTSVRDADVACRMGGDEFLLVMRRTPVGVCERVIQRVRDNWEAVRPYDVCFSAGIAAVSHSGVDAAVAAADAALYEAKSAGRSRVVIATAAQDTA